VAYSPNGTTLASGSSDRTIILWDVKTGEETATLKGHADTVRSVAFSPGGRLLASGSDDKTIRLWEVKKGK
jgi:WD40 repeat protein